jgi:hypothetical protein
MIAPKSDEFAFSARDTHQLDAKEAIGRACAELIHPSQSVIIDAGTTTFGANGDYGPIATGAGGQVLTQELGRAAVIHFQAAIPTTASGTALASNACKEATVKNLLSNTAIIWVGVSGVSAANGYELNPGEAITLKVSNTNLIYCLSASGTINVCVIATN